MYRQLCQNHLLLRLPVRHGPLLSIKDHMALHPLPLKAKVSKRASSPRVKILAHFKVVHRPNLLVASVTYMDTQSATVVRRMHCIILILTNKLVVNLTAGNNWLWINWRTVCLRPTSVLGVYNHRKRRIYITYHCTAVDISDLQKASSVTRATISNAIIFFDKNGFIELLDIRGSKFSGCKLKPSKLNEIIAHYKNKKSVLENK